MKNLEKLTSIAYHLTLEDLVRVFQSCSKLIELSINTSDSFMDEHIENLLRTGFQRLRRLHLGWNVVNYPWPVLQEMLT